MNEGQRCLSSCRYNNNLFCQMSKTATFTNFKYLMFILILSNNNNIGEKNVIRYFISVCKMNVLVISKRNIYPEDAG